MHIALELHYWLFLHFQRSRLMAVDGMWGLRTPGNSSCGGMLNNHLTANLQENLPVKEFDNRLKFDRNMAMTLVCSPHLFTLSTIFHHCFTNTDAAFCYRCRTFHGVCMLGALVSPAKWLNRSICSLWINAACTPDSCAWSKEPCNDGVRISATWQMRLNDRTRRRYGLVSNYCDHLSTFVSIWVWCFV